jgi:hypothetical protein
LLGGQTDILLFERWQSMTGSSHIRRGTMRRLILALAIGVIAPAAPVWAAGTDQEVAQQIADTLRTSGRLKGYSIAVKYKDGTARLEGTVRSQQQLDQALDIVNRAPEVKRVINNLAVQPGPAGSSAPEAASQARPSMAMQQPRGSVVPPGPLPSQMYTASTAAAAQNVPQQQALPAAASQAAYAQPNSAPLPAPVAMQPRPIAAVAPQTQAMAPQPMQPQMIQQQQMMMQQQMQQQQLMQQARGPIPMAPQGQQVPYYAVAGGRPMPVNYRQPVAAPPGYQAAPLPEYVNSTGAGAAPQVYDQPHLPNYAWPSYAPYPNYAALTYPKQYSPAAWPYIGPFYPYPQVPLGWRKVTLEWDDGWWFLNFADDRRHCGHGHY